MRRSIWTRVLPFGSALLVAASWLLLCPTFPAQKGSQAEAASGPTIKLSPTSGLNSSMVKIAVAYVPDEGAGCDMSFQITWDGGSVNIVGVQLVGNTGCKGTTVGEVPYPAGYAGSSKWHTGKHIVCAVPARVRAPAGVTINTVCATFTIRAAPKPSPTPTPTPSPTPTESPTPSPTDTSSPTAPPTESPSPASAAATSTASAGDASGGQGSGGVDPLLVAGAAIVGLGAAAALGLAVRAKATRR